MKRSLLAAACALAIGPSAASAALILNVEDIVVPTNPPAEVVREVEVFFTESAPAENENLFGYNIRINLDNKGTGIALVPPGMQPTAHPWVLPAGSSFTDFNSNAATIRVAADANAAQNIDNNEGVVKFSVRVPAGTPDGEYPLTVVESETSFANDQGNAILFPINSGAVFVGIPEPTTFGLVALGGGLLALRRRRKA